MPLATAMGPLGAPCRPGGGALAIVGTWLTLGPCVPVIVLGAAVMTVPAACPLVASATYVNED